MPLRVRLRVTMQSTTQHKLIRFFLMPSLLGLPFRIFFFFFEHLPSVSTLVFYYKNMIFYKILTFM
ncbi:unnamed protein product, partial [Arabidopsis halleri]